MVPFDCPPPNTAFYAYAEQVRRVADSSYDYVMNWENFRNSRAKSLKMEESTIPTEAPAINDGIKRLVLGLLESTDSAISSLLESVFSLSIEEAKVSYEELKPLEPVVYEALSSINRLNLPSASEEATEIIQKLESFLLKAKTLVESLKILSTSKEVDENSTEFKAFISNFVMDSCDSDCETEEELDFANLELIFD